MQKIMKAALAVCLVVVVCIGLTACGKSQAVRNCETLIKAIDGNFATENLKDVTTENLGCIAAAGTFYDMLSEEDAKKVNTSALDAAEKKLLEVTGSPFQACKKLMGHMKDPASFRIYGNVVFADMSALSIDLGTAYVTAITCDAKNSWGAYNGKSVYEVVASNDSVFFFTEEDEAYIDPMLLLDPPGKFKDTMQSYIFSGKRIAELIGCEYMD